MSFIEPIDIYKLTEFDEFSPKVRNEIRKIVIDFTRTVADFDKDNGYENISEIFNDEVQKYSMWNSILEKYDVTLVDAFAVATELLENDLTFPRENMINDVNYYVIGNLLEIGIDHYQLRDDLEKIEKALENDDIKNLNEVKDSLKDKVKEISKEYIQEGFNLYQKLKSSDYDKDNINYRLGAMLFSDESTLDFIDKVYEDNIKKFDNSTEPRELVM